MLLGHMGDKQLLEPEANCLHTEYAAYTWRRHDGRMVLDTERFQKEQVACRNCTDSLMTVDKKSLLTFCSCPICISTGHIRKGRWSVGNTLPSPVFCSGLTQTWTTVCTAWFCCWALAAAVAAKEAAIALASASGCAGGRGLRNAAMGPVD